MSSSGTATEPKRRVNRRGNGDQLRDELIDAAVTIIEADGGEAVSLRSVARQVGIAATSVYLHFPDVDHLVAAVVARAFGQLTAATASAARATPDAPEELRARCRAYCRFALDHPRLYQVMFQADLPLASVADGPDNTPGRASFQNLVAAVQRCIDESLAAPHDDPFRLASLIWTADHGLVLARISRPTFPWAPIDQLVNEMVDRLMGFEYPTPSTRRRRTR